MIKKLVQKFHLVERDVNVLTNVLIFLLLAILFRAAYLIFNQELNTLWGLLSPFTSLAAALLVSKTASRLILNGQVIREDEKRQEVVRVTHHLMATTKDLKARVGYFKKLMVEGDKPIAIMLGLAKSIEQRYESLFEREPYKYLPGESVDLINNLSGSIYGIQSTAEILKNASATNPLILIKTLTGQTSEQYASMMDKLLTEIQTLIDQIYAIRIAIEITSDKTINKC